MSTPGMDTGRGHRKKEPICVRSRKHIRGAHDEISGGKLQNGGANGRTNGKKSDARCVKFWAAALIRCATEGNQQHIYTHSSRCLMMRNDYIFNFFSFFFSGARCSSLGSLSLSLSLSVSVVLFSVRRYTLHGRHHFTFASCNTVTGVHSILRTQSAAIHARCRHYAYFLNCASSSSKTKRQQRKINETVARHQDMGCS